MEVKKAFFQNEETATVVRNAHLKWNGQLFHITNWETTVAKAVFSCGTVFSYALSPVIK
jgi:hypothetical protein